MNIHISAISTKGINFCDFVFAFLVDRALLKGGLPLTEAKYSKGSIFSFRTTQKEITSQID